MSLLNQLTANYTDSDIDSDANEDKDDAPGEDVAMEKEAKKDTPTSPLSRDSTAANTPQKKVEKTVNPLVSYANEEDDDDLDSHKDDLEEQDEIFQSEPMDTGTEDGDDESTKMDDDRESALKLIPAAPVGKCPQHLQEKINSYILKVQMGNFDSNAIIQNNKAYRNPSIYEKLIDHLGLDEMGSNYPLDLFDAHCWGKESYYDELAKVQKDEMDRREKDRKDKLKVDVVSGAKKSGDDDIKKQRKSRFDQGIPTTMASAKANPPPLLTSVPSGTKPTISAFGTLMKK